MGQIIPFPVRHSSPGEVYCKPLNLHFPKLYRCRAIATEDDYAKVGITRENACAVLNRPSAFDFNCLLSEKSSLHFDPENGKNTLAGSVTVDHDPVAFLQGNDTMVLRDSVVIHHHESFESVDGFISALFTLVTGGDEISDEGSPENLLREFECTELNGAWFTRNNIPTRSHWPGPLLIYRANLPNDDIWVYAIGPDGKPVDLGRSGV